MRTGSCELISHDQKIQWRQWLLKQESAVRKARASFEDIEGAYIVHLYDADLKIIDEIESFISSLPVK